MTDTTALVRSAPAMKALTICQPYAELILRGEKPIENRTWPTRYRGPLLIHAGKSRAWMEPEDDEQYPGMAFGAIVGRAELVACLSLLYPADGPNWPDRWKALANHPHANGPYCFVLEHIERFVQPIPYRGAQGLFDVTLPEQLGISEKAQ